MGIEKGNLITFEGIEGSGKSTQLNEVYKFLKKRKIKCIKTREPGGTKLAEKIRKLIIKDLKNNEDNLTELLLLFAARSNHFLKIKKLIKKGYLVLCDRYVDSTYAYQHYEQGQDIKLINFLQNLISKKSFPKITFFIDIPVKISKLRVKGRGRLDRFDQYGEKKLNKLRKSFINLTKKHNRIIKIDGTKNKKDITIQIVNYLIKKNVIKNFK
ncbi:dTMP kinase [Candidatus Pelagibacter sp. HIMB1517]|uniref:dTMP kinase n=1 Tax=Candidatus Pelagibacter sp. HIMB1517 TaxID=3413341 RepID=UPI003F87946E